MDVSKLLRSLGSPELSRQADVLSDYGHGLERQVDIGSVTVEAVIDRGEVDAMELLSLEQKERAQQSIGALVEKYNNHRVSEEDFSVVAIETETGARQFTITHSAGNGLQLGSWDDIFSERNTGCFMVEIAGIQVDTRSGMTLGVYKAMVEQAKGAGQILPDSPQLAEQNEQPWTATLRTGEPEQSGQFSAPFVEVDIDGEIDAYPSKRDHESAGVRFRPSIPLELF